MLLLSACMLAGATASCYKLLGIIRQPQAIFVLGGHEERERFAAEFAQAHPALPIWVSSGSPPDYARDIFTNRQIASDRLRLNYEAEDTVTNFTSLVDEFKAEKINSVYLVTSENHMDRAKVISNIVFGSYGITIKPIAVPSENPPEARLKCVRDGLRALLWITTGETGRSWYSLHAQPSQAIASPKPLAENR